MDSICTVIAYILAFPTFIFSQITEVSTNLANESGIYGEISTSLNSFISTFSGQLQSLALAIAALFFFVSLASLAVSERFTLELFVKSFAKLGVSVAAIEMCPTLITHILEFAKVFNKDIKTWVNSSLNGGSFEESAVDKIADQLISTFDKKQEIWLALGLLLCSMIPIVVAILAAIATLAIINIVAFTNIIERSIRGAFLPIGISFLGDDGWHGAGGRYIKKFVACCCQLGMITIVTSIISLGTAAGQKEVINVFTNNLSSIVDFASMFTKFLIPLLVAYIGELGIAIAGCMSLFKSQQLINEVFGA